MQAVDGPNSSQFEWHQDGVKTKSEDRCVNRVLNSGVRSHFDPVPWNSSVPACPRDGDWVMVLDGAHGFGAEPTMARREGLKAAEFSYSSSDGEAVWQRRIPGTRPVRGWAKEIPSRPWFDGPPGLRIRFLHGDGALAGEYRVDRADGGQGVALREVWVEG